MGYIPDTASQVDVTETVAGVAFQAGEIRRPEDLQELQKLMFSRLDFRSYTEAEKAYERNLRWKRTASQILGDGYVYEQKGCTDLAVVFCALCRAKGLETRFVKLTRPGKTHSIVEVKLPEPEGWYMFDAAILGAVPVPGEMTEEREFNGWRLWKKGRDAWELGLVDSASLRNIIRKRR